MDSTPVALGFKCPRCSTKEAWVDRIALPQLELICCGCGHHFAVEP